MPSLDVSALTDEQRPTGVWAAALLHALARDEAAGRRPQRLTEPKLDTWSRFRGRLTSADFVALLFEDAAVIHRVPFDPVGARRANSAATGCRSRLADSWIRTLALAPAERSRAQTTSPSRLGFSGLPTRMARSELHVVKPHQKVLELPGRAGSSLITS